MTNEELKSKIEDVTDVLSELNNFLSMAIDCIEDKDSSEVIELEHLLARITDLELLKKDKVPEVDPWAVSVVYTEYLEGRLMRYQEACTGLLNYIKEKFPKDFETDGRGFICPHHCAIDIAVYGEDCFPTSKIPCPGQFGFDGR